MTFEERDQLTRFLQLLTQAQPGPKDPEAEALIRDAYLRQPDAPYLLVQRMLQLEHALKDATEKPSFVGDANAWGRAPAVSRPASQPAPSPAPVPMQQVPAPAPQPGAWGSGLLGTVAMTAGGVVAGSLLAQGIGSLFGHHNNPSADHAATPPGGGTLVDTDYGASNQDDGGYVADDFDTGGDSGDVG